MTIASDLRSLIRDIPDWPKKGILFRDITPLLANPDALRSAVTALCDEYSKEDIDCVAAIEARGFIFGAAVAAELGVGFVPIRKPGKLPYETASVTYDLEYGSDSIEMHIDAVEKGSKVLMLDDLLATGGTMKAACQLVESVGAKVAGISFLIELNGLNGRDKLQGYDVKTVLSL